MRAPGVVRQEGEGQREEHPDDVDEGRGDAVERCEEGMPPRVVHPSDQRPGGEEGADESHGREAVMVVGAEVNRSVLPHPAHPTARSAGLPRRSAAAAVGSNVLAPARRGVDRHSVA